MDREITTGSVDKAQKSGSERRSGRLADGNERSSGRRRRKIFRGLIYSPLPSQLRFHQSQARFKGYSGSIGSGKSQALCQEAVKLSYVNAGRTGLIGAPTYPMLRDATLASMLEVLESNEIPYELNKSENVLTFLETGSRVLLRSLDEFERRYCAAD